MGAETTRPWRTRRLEAGLSMEQLAALVGVDVRTIGRLERTAQASESVRAVADRVLREHQPVFAATPGPWWRSPARP